MIATVDVSGRYKTLHRVVSVGCYRVVSLGSRKTLCINDAVSRLGSDTKIADRCLDMQKGKKIMPTAPSKPPVTDYWKEKEKEVSAGGRAEADGVRSAVEDKGRGA